LRRADNELHFERGRVPALHRRCRAGHKLRPPTRSSWAAAAAAGGFFAGYAATGTLKSAVIGAFSAAVTAGIARSGMSGYEQMAAQAVTGGVVESLQGGSFGHGFVAAGLTANFMPQVGGYSAPVRTALGALIGGTISAVTGGKFANGAISGAVQGAMARNASQRAFNDGGGSKAPNKQLAQETIDAVQEAMFRDQAFHSYETELQAHQGFQRAVRSVAPKAEVGVKIGFKGGKYYLGAPFSIGATGSITGLFERGHLPITTTLSALSHYHPGGDAFLSGTGAAYRYDAWDTDNSAFQAWNRLGDGMSAYNEGINVYSFSQTDYDYFNYNDYREMQLKANGAEVPICMATRLGCP
jgi:hypothetical protein